MDEMERRVKLERLASLDKIYIDVLFYLLQGWKVSKIAEKLNQAEKTISTRNTKIYSDLKVSGRDELVTEYSPIFFEFFKTEADLDNLGLIKAEMLRQARTFGTQSASAAETETQDSVRAESSNLEVAESPADLTSGQALQSEERARPSTRRPENRLPWFLIGVGILVLCLLGISGFLFVTRIAPALFQQNFTPTEVLATEAATNTTPPLPTETQPILPSETSSPAASDTPVPPTPTVSSPAPTPLPADTITPQPPALFETDFESGFPAGMEYVRENLDIVDGELVAHEYTLLGFGDGTWKNYQVEYDARKHTYCWGLQNNGVAAHAIDQENMVMWSWNYCETGWFEIVNGDWITITADRDIIANPGTVVKIRLVAENGNFTVYVNNTKNSSYFNEKYTQGKVYILVTDSSVIDNIRISQLP